MGESQNNQNQHNQNQNNQYQNNQYQNNQSRQTSMNHTPVIKVVADNPWRVAFTKVAWGFFFCFVNIQYYSLHLLLPLLGSALIVIGLRMTKRENRCFHVAYILAVVNCIRIVQAYVYQRLCSMWTRHRWQDRHSLERFL